MPATPTRQRERTANRTDGAGKPPDGGATVVAEKPQRSPVVYGFERLAALRASGLEPLLEEHWLECGTDQEEVPLAVDWRRYQVMEEEGIFKSIGARRAGRLVGYSGFFVMRHLHYRTSWHALNDVIYVTPEERELGTGKGLIEWAEATFFKQLGPAPVRIIYHAKVEVKTAQGTFSDLLEHLGYSHVENGHWKLVRA